MLDAKLFKVNYHVANSPLERGGRQAGVCKRRKIEDDI
jgi:hypothetical protein